MRSLLRFGVPISRCPLKVHGGIAFDRRHDVRSLLVREAPLHANSASTTWNSRHTRTSRNPDWPTRTSYVTLPMRLCPTKRQTSCRHPEEAARHGPQQGDRQRLTSGDADVGKFAFYADNVHRYGNPGSPPAIFRRVAATFGRDCEVLTVKGPDGRLPSGVLSFFFRAT